MVKVVYVTGCLGFIGYQVAKQCLEKGWFVIGVDKETYAANMHFLPMLMQNPRFKYIKSDINDLTSLLDCDYIINTAAESHVDTSIVNSAAFLQSNVNGVYNLLQLLKNTKFKIPVFLQFSTDEVYGDIESGCHTEADILKPSNPYSATKAAADMLICAWARTFNIPYVIVRPTNNYGIGQYVEKLIPKAIKYLTLGRKIPLHAQGTPIRTWLHVSDTANAIITIVESGITGEIFNICGNHEEQNLEIAKKIIKHHTDSDSYLDYVDFSWDRPGSDVRYSIDDSKLRNLGWKQTSNFDDELEKVVDYYKTNFVW